ncbi:MAG: 2-C-methyl-D-erythritol 2,4-cyclodiphosphate synthase [Candidatus Carbobacillus altaicus]|uniref:2-C-methyl-D-erythritol 2,4-cyclodiphosphate synthase n=1 Tax=Candidatus Carbonibacillus altaicus TaxID=2163959 RepID=A0A2R6XZW3_9BACL|nr:MAG: 2-C-methyl-D-erythritol 2,4-cyclodiphosphate synthase [Candidatus Carbobacillus altaicus]
MVRIGFGYDVHVLQIGRPFILGGVHIPFEKGPLGHSDADVLLHALADALLGSLALGDIGHYFPPHDPQYRNMDSKEIVRTARTMVEEKGYALVNADMTVVLEKPRIGPYIGKMRETIASLLSVSVDSVSIKATTSEGMGFVGRGEGVQAYAVVLVARKQV